MEVKGNVKGQKQMWNPRNKTKQKNRLSGVMSVNTGLKLFNLMLRDNLKCSFSLIIRVK